MPKFAFPPALFAAALLVAGCSQSTTPTEQVASYAPRTSQVEVDVVRVERQAIAAVQQFTGNLLPRRVTRIMAEVNGVVQTIPQVGAKFDVSLGGKRYTEQLSITYGQAVKAGDLLVQLDPTDFELDLQMSRAKLAKATADLMKLQSWDRPEEIQRLEAMRNEVVARQKQAQRDLARIEPLVASRAVSQAKYEQATMDVATAVAMVESAEATLATAKAGPTAEEIAVQQALVAQAEAEVAQKNRELAKTTLTAPYDGIVTAINVEVGERVSTAGEPLLELMDLRFLIAEISVPESYVGSVHINDEVFVKAAGEAKHVPGLVVAINDLVDPATRTFPVRVAIDNSQTHFKAGQFATVKLSLQKSGEASVAAPSRAIVFIEGQPHVFVLAGDRVQQRAVQPGLTSEGMVEIVSGLAAGDQVVIDDPTLLSDGMQVSVKPHSTEVALR